MCQYPLLSVVPSLVISSPSPPCSWTWIYLFIYLTFRGVSSKKTEKIKLAEKIKHLAYQQ
jgi:hypothetical protein